MSKIDEKRLGEIAKRYFIYPSDVDIDALREAAEYGRRLGWEARGEGVPHLYWRAVSHPSGLNTHRLTAGQATVATHDPATCAEEGGACRSFAGEEGGRDG